MKVLVLVRLIKSTCLNMDRATIQSTCLDMDRATIQSTCLDMDRATIQSTCLNMDRATIQPTWTWIGQLFSQPASWIWAGLVHLSGTSYNNVETNCYPPRQSFIVFENVLSMKLLKRYLIFMLLEHCFESDFCYQLETSCTERN